jgi:hypothetical protein
MFQKVPPPRHRKPIDTQARKRAPGKTPDAPNHGQRDSRGRLRAAAAEEHRAKTTERQEGAGRLGHGGVAAEFPQRITWRRKTRRAAEAVRMLHGDDEFRRCLARKRENRPLLIKNLHSVIE